MNEWINVLNASLPNLEIYVYTCNDLFLSFTPCIRRAVYWECTEPTERNFMDQRFCMQCNITIFNNYVMFHILIHLMITHLKRYKIVFAKWKLCTVMFHINVADNMVKKIIELCFLRWGLTFHNYVVFHSLCVFRSFIHSFIYLRSVNPYKVNQPIRYRTCHNKSVS